MSGICHSHLRNHIIRPVLKEYSLWTDSREELIIITAAQESHGGYYLVQLKNGPARGLYQMEPLTYKEVRIMVAPRAGVNIFMPTDIDNLIWDFRLATVACCLQYWRFEEPLPVATDIEGLARYYKKYYNSVLGAAKIEDVMKNYAAYLHN